MTTDEQLKAALGEAFDAETKARKTVESLPPTSTAEEWATARDKFLACVKVRLGLAQRVANLEAFNRRQENQKMTRQYVVVNTMPQDSQCLGRVIGTYKSHEAAIKAVRSVQPKERGSYLPCAVRVTDKYRERGEWVYHYENLPAAEPGIDF